MATIPTYNPSVGINAPPTVRMDPRSISANSYGQDVFRGVGNLAAGLKEQQDKQDKFDVASAYNNAMTQLNNSLYGDNGLFTLQGDNAIYKAATKDQPAQAGVYQRASDALTSIGKNMLDSLSNNRTRFMFQQAWQEPFQKYQLAAQQYENKQKNVAFDNNYKSMADNLSKTYVNNLALAAQESDEEQKKVYQDAADQALRDIQANESLNGQHYGLDRNVVAENINKRMNSVIGTTISQFIQNDDLKSANFYKNYYGDKLNADTQMKITAEMRPKKVQIDSQNIASQLFNQFGIDNEKGAMNTLRSLYGNVPEFSTYAAKLRNIYSDERNFRNQADQKNYQDVFGRILSAGSISGMQSILDGSNLKPTERITVQNFIDARMRRNERAAKAAYAPYTAIDKHWMSYEQLGIITDLNRIDKLQNLITDGEMLNDAQQTELNTRMKRVNDYWSYLASQNGGRQTQQQQEQPVTVDYDNLSEGDKLWYQGFQTLKDAHPDWTDSKVTEVLNAYNSQGGQ